MLSHLSVQNYAIADHLELEFDAGMTVITGETGAGKSIMLDALSLCLGTRADAGIVRHGSKQADISANFDLRHLPRAKQWLAERELDAEDDCILRRVVTAEGRSRGFINGTAATAQDLKSLGELLIDIHSQHHHQSLLKKSNHRHIVDNFGGHQQHTETVKSLAKQWQALNEKLTTRRARVEEDSAQLQLLTYQVDELDKLNVQTGEVDALENEFRQLSNAEEIQRNNQHALGLCENDEDGGALAAIRQALRLLQDNQRNDHSLSSIIEMMESADIQLQEAANELQHRVDRFEFDPERAFEVEQRLNEIYAVARRHKINAEELPDLHAKLQAELAAISGDDASIEGLERQLAELHKQYNAAAEALSTTRQTAGQQLAQQVNEQLQLLSMKGCLFAVHLEPLTNNECQIHGREDIELLISTQSGRPPQSLGKIASGGELSRISLAIQVIVARTSTVATMVFDEVDVGIGGAVAEVVGNLLRELSGNSQILCVTHLAQVACKGHQHLQVSKSSDEEHGTRTQLLELIDEQRVSELARMMGGINITEQTLAHAREMLLGS